MLTETGMPSYYSHPGVAVESAGGIATLRVRVREGGIVTHPEIRHRDVARVAAGGEYGNC